MREVGYMEIELIDRRGTWRDVANAARTTISQPPGEGKPSDEWIERIIKSEHSPLRLIEYRVKWFDIPSYVSTHIVRHKHGIESFVSTQREDRTGVDRSERSQTNPVNHEILINAQAILNISKVRLCKQADKNTIKVWKLFLDEIVKKYDPILYKNCVPSCVYRGFCPEFKSCGYYEGKGKEVRGKYIKGE